MTPTQPWDASWWTIVVEAGDPLDPIDWNAPVCADWELPKKPPSVTNVQSVPTWPNW